MNTPKCNSNTPYTGRNYLNSTQITLQFSLFYPSQRADIVGIGFEEEVIIVPETVGTVSICVVTNVTLDERHTASAILQTETVSAEG